MAGAGRSRLPASAPAAAPGALVLAGLVVLRTDAPRIWNGLISGAGTVMVVVSAVAGLATLGLVWRSRFGPARASAALAVAAVVAGWAAAQQPYSGLTPG